MKAVSLQNHHQKVYSGAGGGSKNDQAQRNSTDLGVNLVRTSDNFSSQNQAIMRSSGEQNTTTTMPSFEFGSVLKDVVSRLNSSSGQKLKKSSSASCTSDRTAAEDTASPIPTINMSASRDSIFSRLGQRNRTESIFNSRFCPESERIVTTIRSSTTAGVDGSNESTPSTGFGVATSGTQKRQPLQDVTRPETKRVSPFDLASMCVHPVHIWIERHIHVGSFL